MNFAAQGGRTSSHNLRPIPTSGLIVQAVVGAFLSPHTFLLPYYVRQSLTLNCQTFCLLTFYYAPISCSNGMSCNHLKHCDYFHDNLLLCSHSHRPIYYVSLVLISNFCTQSYRYSQAFYSHTFIFKVSQNHVYIYTPYIWCIYGMFGRKITKYTVIYGAYIRFWPTL